MKKVSFFSVKKKSILIFCCALFFFVSCFLGIAVRTVIAKPNLQPTIVVDAGHGGRDGGAVGELSNESELNLKYARCLQEILTQNGYNVVMTRDDMAGLYNPLSSNKKKSEMEKRIKIIKKANPDLVVSVHMNSFQSQQVRGAQVFSADTTSSFALGECVQTQLYDNIDFAKKTVKKGDYYILNCSPCPSILIECGFLSNPEEERLLVDKDYMQKFCYAVFCGIFDYYRI